MVRRLSLDLSQQGTLESKQRRIEHRILFASLSMCFLIYRVPFSSFSLSVTCNHFHVEFSLDHQRKPLSYLQNWIQKRLDKIKFARLCKRSFKLLIVAFQYNVYYHEQRKGFGGDLCIFLHESNQIKQNHNYGFGFKINNVCFRFIQTNL